MKQATFPPGLNAARVVLRIGLGLAAILAGLDKFVGLLADWPGYVAPLVAAVLPVSPEAFMQVVGVVEMGVGLAILSRWSREAAWVAMTWLLLVAGNLVLTGRFLDVAVRDIEMALAAFALARLTEAHEAAVARARPVERGAAPLEDAA
jgi:uncharacterized membrane protein YphA (DoxX/SURF4 family)